MKTDDLAKELSALALTLRSLSYEARESVANALELGKRDYATEARKTKFHPAPLTIRDISRAVDAATRSRKTSVNLREDIFNQRVDKLASQYADHFERQVRAGTPAPTGTLFGARYTRLPDGIKPLEDAVPKWGRTAINAECWAWKRAAGYVMRRLVPAYGKREVELYSDRRYDGNDRAAWNLRDKLNGKVDEWQELNTFFACSVGVDGNVTAIHGIDPGPFVELLQKVSAGNADPLGIFAEVV